MESVLVFVFVISLLRLERLRSNDVEMFCNVAFLQGRVIGVVNPLTTNVPYHIETSQLICRANQLASFYMMGNIGR